MAKESQIQWTDATWNIARGCTKVDEDCKFCYMYRDAMDGTRYDPLEVVRTKTVFDMPLKYKETESKVWAGKPLIFTCSLTDFFHESIDSYRSEAWDIIRKCPHLIFQILTKRPERITEHLPADWGNGWDNVWLGTSVGSQKAVDIRIPHLLSIKSSVIFLSIEPLYEKVDLSTWIGYICNHAENNRNINSLPSSNRRGIGNYRDGRDLEISQTGGRQMEQDNPTKQMQKSKSRTQYEGISNDTGNVSEQEIYDGSTQASILPFLRRNTGGNDSESQGWKQNEQSSTQLRINDGQRTGCTCEKYIEEGKIRPVGREELHGKTEFNADNGNNSKKSTGSVAGENCSTIQCEIPEYFKNMQGRQMGTRFWTIIGGESGNDKGKYRYRPCELDWIESIVIQSKSAKIPIFIKQMGTYLSKVLNMSDRHGGDIDEFPEHLRIREFPQING